MKKIASGGDNTDTDRHTDIATTRKNRPKGRFFENYVHAAGMLQTLCRPSKNPTTGLFYYVVYILEMINLVQNGDAQIIIHIPPPLQNLLHLFLLLPLLLALLLLCLLVPLLLEVGI